MAWADLLEYPARVAVLWSWVASPILCVWEGRRLLRNPEPEQQIAGSEITEMQSECQNVYSLSRPGSLVLDLATHAG